MKKKQKNKGCLIILVFAILLFGGLIYALLNADELGANLTDDQQIIKDGTNLESNKVKKISSILSKCGVKDIVQVKHDKMLDNEYKKSGLGYRIDSEVASNIILNLDKTKKVYMVKYAGNKLYANGKVKHKLNEYVLDIDEMSDIQYKSENAVKTVLKAPDSADFPNINEWNIWKENGKIYASSFVNEANSFGQEMKNEFQITFNSSKRVVSMILDGKEYLK